MSCDRIVLTLFTPCTNCVPQRAPLLLQVLDTFLYADRQLLQSFPDLLRAKVYVHFQSDVQVRPTCV